MENEQFDFKRLMNGNKKCTFHLNNKFRYEGYILSVSKDFLEISDTKTNKYYIISIKEINVMDYE
jgi:hypothetical protein